MIRIPIRLDPRIVGLFLVLISNGCTAREVSITGSVSYQNKPLVSGVVSFLFDDGTLASGQIDPNGNYAVTTLAHGHARVGVYSPKPAIADANLKRGDFPTEGKNPNASKWVQIPVKYANPETSGKEANIVFGKNMVNVMLD